MLNKQQLRSGLLAFAGSIMGLLVGVAPPISAAQAADQKPPLEMKTFGSFYIGGHTEPGLLNISGLSKGTGEDVQNNCVEGTVTVDQMFVQYMLAKKKTHKYPVVFVHGGGASGAVFEATDDGSEGWVQYFVREGFDVYWIDKPSRGRSAFNPTPFNKVRCGQAKPEDMPVFNSGGSISGQNDFCPYLNKGNADKTGVLECGPATWDALGELLKKIGPSIMVGWSQGGPDVYRTYRANPKLVAAIIGAEPMLQPVDQFNKFIKVPVVNIWSKKDSFGAGECFGLMGRACATVARKFARQVNAAGGDAKLILLSDRGIEADHSLMRGASSDVIAGIMIKWIAKHVESKKND